MSAAQILEQIRQLPPNEFEHLLTELQADAWDAQIARDAENGNLDAMFAKLEGENVGKPEVPLNDFLDQSELS